ncbi:hypothetical protein CPB84DRAFT_1844888 [Gymnopilus junonius]|uniref:Uncharacterized protein n=1 Tax=Gymnopilus junonius TaxID=109634 RepID=A0A9P5NT13_GYMJU|nr:hypothetical protein CPB84DRAFT_1844888 [Gymnopilus junonius]
MPPPSRPTPDVPQPNLSQSQGAKPSKGVRWTSLHRLSYWDPVNHTILGFLHNWVEGILKYHLCTLWGIGHDEKQEEKLKDVDLDEQWTDADISDSGSELDELCQEVAEYDNQAARAMLHMLPPDSPSPSSTTLNSLDSSSPTTPTQPLFAHDTDMDDLHDPDFIPPLSLDTPPFNFSEAQLQTIHSCIENITLPTWVQHPPVNLGDPSHGKLKAHEYLTLFTSIFPLIIPELWHGTNATDFGQEHLQCFHHLVSATNIIASFTTSLQKADDYMQHYVTYRAAIQWLFPHFPSMPNHHYAMHNGDLLKRWGPMPSLSEFFGERVNGMLQSTKTNRQLTESPRNTSLTPIEAAEVLAQAPKLDDRDYVEEEEHAPFINYPGFKAWIFDSQPSDDSELVIIEPHHILTHLTTFQWPPGTYGIDCKTLVNLIVCWLSKLLFNLHLLIVIYAPPTNSDLQLYELRPHDPLEVLQVPEHVDT